MDLRTKFFIAALFAIAVWAAVVQDWFTALVALLFAWDGFLINEKNREIARLQADLP